MTFGNGRWYAWRLHLCSMRLGLATCCTGFTYRNRGKKTCRIRMWPAAGREFGFPTPWPTWTFSFGWFQKIDDFSSRCEGRKMRHGFSLNIPALDACHGSQIVGGCLHTSWRGSGSSILQLGPIMLSQCFPGLRWLKRPLNHFRKHYGTPWALSTTFTIILAAEKSTMQYTQFFSRENQHKDSAIDDSGIVPPSIIMA